MVDIDEEAVKIVQTSKKQKISKHDKIGNRVQNASDSCVNTSNDSSAMDLSLLRHTMQSGFEDLKQIQRKQVSSDGMYFAEKSLSSYFLSASVAAASAKAEAKALREQLDQTRADGEKRLKDDQASRDFYLIRQDEHEARMRGDLHFMVRHTAAVASTGNISASLSSQGTASRSKKLEEAHRLETEAADLELTASKYPPGSGVRERVLKKIQELKERAGIMADEALSS